MNVLVRVTPCIAYNILIGTQNNPSYALFIIAWYNNEKDKSHSDLTSDNTEGPHKLSKY